MCGWWAVGARSPRYGRAPTPARLGQTTRRAYPWWVHTATWGGKTAKQNGAGLHRRAHEMQEIRVDVWTAGRACALP